MSQHHRNKGETIDEWFQEFQEQCFCVDADLFNFQDLLHAQQPI